MSKRARSLRLSKCQIFGSEPVLVLLFYLDLIVNSDFTIPGEYSGSWAAALLLLAFPFWPHDFYISGSTGRIESLQK